MDRRDLRTKMFDEMRGRTQGIFQEKPQAMPAQPGPPPRPRKGKERDFSPARLKSSNGEYHDYAYSRETPFTEPEQDPNEVPDCYFPMRSNCSVTLYQDACTPQLALFDQIKMADETTYKATNAFQDMHDAIMNAKHFIYFTDWSLWHELTLVRGGGELEISVGELLKQKANEGVKVLGLIWAAWWFLDTHDKEAEKFFKDSKVELVRVANGSAGWNPESYWTFTHHQKCLMMDAPHPNDPEKRQPVAFLGGLDLTKGRYDSLHHPLFSTLDNLHKNDFYQGFSSHIRYGPREPWHDIHSKVVGEIAVDEIKNFEERWVKEVASHLQNDLVNIAQIPNFSVVKNLEEDSWNCQMFRSIASRSAAFDATRLRQIGIKTNKYVDDSIQRAFIHQIERAERFIYIESQYFIGSSQQWNWNGWYNVGADQEIPYEIVKKIEKKINADEDFHAYIVLPLFPEGHIDGHGPFKSYLEEMLYFQRFTMEMMYTKIAECIRKTGKRGVSPQDYLTFYFLGKRVTKVPADLPAPPNPDGFEAKLRETRRFMIYVHSKMMIVDDSYIIVGSANLNQRSMDGGRDTEIAMGSYQPQYQMNGGVLPKGRVYGFRKALFIEHLRCTSEIFDDPSSATCVDHVKSLAEANWKVFKDNWRVKEPLGHLMPYPIHIDTSGKVTAARDYTDIKELAKLKIEGEYHYSVPYHLVTAVPYVPEDDSQHN